MREPAKSDHRDLRAWVEEYLDELRAQSYAPGTVYNYRQQLARLVEFLEARALGVESLALEETVDQYVTVATGQQRPPATYSVVRRFIEWARRKNYLPSVVKRHALPPSIEDYLVYCSQHRGLATRTVQHYEVILRALSDFLRARGEQLLPEIPLDNLDAFLDTRGKTLSRGSLSGVVSALRGFLKYLHLMGDESEDRSRLLEGPAIYAQAKLPRYLEDSQVEAALTSVDSSTASGVRDWAILMILHHYGWRAGEVAGLNIDDVDFERRRLKVRRLKGGGRQIFPLVDAVEDALRAYLKVRPASPHLAVFITVQAPYRALTAMAVTGRVRSYLQKTPGVRARGAHALRHTLARRLRQAGAPLAVISRVLGHCSLDSAETYIRIATDELCEVANNYAELL